jgi:hypothetical protein
MGSRGHRRRVGVFHDGLRRRVESISNAGFYVKLRGRVGIFLGGYNGRACLLHGGYSGRV